MAEKKANMFTLIIVISFSILILTGTGFGIWLGIKNSCSLQEHPSPNWSYKISGNLDVADFNISIADLLEMSSHKEEYYIKGNPADIEAVFIGVSFSYLFDNEIDYTSSAVNITVKAWDGYSRKYNLTEFANDESIILAYAMDCEYLGNYPDGNGYLRLIIPQSDPDDFNGPFCVKNVVELIFE